MSYRPGTGATFFKPPVNSGKIAGKSNAKVRLPLPLLFLVLALVFPITMAVFFGTILLTPFRIITMLLIVGLAFSMAKGKKVDWMAADFVMLAFAFWTCICIARNFAFPFERMGQFLLETAGAYFVVRVYLNRFAHNLLIIKLMFAIACLAAIFAIPESVFHSRFLLEFTDLGLGIPYEQAIGRKVYRLELLRAHSFFSHPILYGLFCANCLALVWYTSNPGAALTKLFLLGAAVFFSLSSAPLLAFNLQIALIAFETFSRSLKGRFKYLIIGTLVGGTFLQLVAAGGVFGVVINYLTFNQVSSYNRVRIWNYGWQNIFAHPFFGLEPETWIRAPWMKESIDNFWIYGTMLGGIPSLLLLVIAIFLIMSRFYRAPDQKIPPSMRRFRIGWSFAFISLVLAGFSVMLFGQMQPLFYMMLGMAASSASIFERESNRKNTAVGTAGESPPQSAGARPAGRETTQAF